MSPQDYFEIGEWERSVGKPMLNLGLIRRAASDEEFKLLVDLHAGIKELKEIQAEAAESRFKSIRFQPVIEEIGTILDTLYDQLAKVETRLKEEQAEAERTWRESREEMRELEDKAERLAKELDGLVDEMDRVARRTEPYEAFRLPIEPDRKWTGFQRALRSGFKAYWPEPRPRPDVVVR